MEVKMSKSSQTERNLGDLSQDTMARAKQREEANDKLVQVLRDKYGTHK